MSFSQTVPVVTAAIAAAALFVAVPASAQTSTMLTSNQASPHKTMMAKTEQAPDARPSTTAQAPGGDKGSGLMAKAGNQLK